MKEIYLIEDHDEALRVWRKAKVRSLDLVHVDAHIDLDIPAAKSIEEILKDAGSARDVKKGLEDLIAFRWYERSLRKQTHIGNYIYPAMREGIVRDFYWIIPGCRHNFGRQVLSVRKILRSVIGPKVSIEVDRPQTMIRAAYLGRTIFVCSLESLPELTGNVLLDVDADFFITPGLSESDPARHVGRHALWTTPAQTASLLRKKKIKTRLLTIAYSVHGGFTPSRFRYLADAFAAAWDPDRFQARYYRHEKAAAAFAAFETFSSRFSYWRAARLDPGLRHPDNHDGFLFLLRHKYSKARREFMRLLSVDPRHAACWMGLGWVALERHRAEEALGYFSKALVLGRRQKIFRELEPAILLGLGRCQMKLSFDAKAETSLQKSKRRGPLNPEVYYYLGLLYEKRKNYEKAAAFFQDAIRLGFLIKKPLKHLKKICCFLDAKDDIIEYIGVMSRRLKPDFRRSDGSTRRFQEK